MTIPPIPFKLIIRATVFAIVAFAAHRYVQHQRDEAYASGVEATTEHYRSIVAQNDRLNRKLEDAATKGVEKVAERLEEKLDQLDRRADVQTSTVREIIHAHPELEECRIPREIIEAKNAIRGELQP